MEQNVWIANQAPEYYFQIFIPVMVWLVGIMLVIGIALKKYTFGKWTPDNPNPYAKQTLGLPIGMFRGILTLSLLFVVVLFEAVNIKDPGFETRTNQLLVAFQMMIAFYFGSKVMHHITSVDVKKTQAKTHAEEVRYNTAGEHVQQSDVTFTNRTSDSKNEEEALG